MSFADFGADVADQLGLTDLVAGLVPGKQTKMEKLHEQEEDFKQFPTRGIDESRWNGLLNFDENYALLLFYKGDMIRIPFLLAPQREVIIEPHAATVTMGQGGGKIVQSEGAPQKEIQIQGTFGLYPNKAGRSSGTGSGFEAFNHIKGIFRRYCYLKRYGNVGDDLSLVYVSPKRQEAWVVEPKQFWSEDAIEHRFNFTYNMTFDALYPYDGRGSKSITEQGFDMIPFFNDFSNLAQMLSESVDRLVSVIANIAALVDNVVDTALKPLLKIANAVADIVNYQETFLDGVSRDFMKNTRRTLRNISFELERLGAQELADKVRDAEHDLAKHLVQPNLFDATSVAHSEAVNETWQANLNKYTAPDGTLVDQTDAEDGGAVATRPSITETLGSVRDLLDKYKSSWKSGIDVDTIVKQLESDIQTGLDRVTFDRDGSRPSPKPGTASRSALEREDNVLTVQTPGNSALSDRPNFAISNTAIPLADAAGLVPPSFRETLSAQVFSAEINQTIRALDPTVVDYRVGKISSSDSIQTLSARLLGDPGRYMELVLLNNLEYPYVASADYIIANDLSNILAYGADIIYPTPKVTTEIVPTRVWRNENDVSVRLSAKERALGNDILLQGGDISWTSNDLRLAYGAENLQQYLSNMLLIKRSRWRRAQSKGLSDYHGISRDISRPILEAEISELFADDKRISGTRVLDVRKEGHVLLVVVAVIVRNYDDPIIVTQRV